MRSPKALWARLGAMTWEEIPHRIREQVRRQVDRSATPPRGDGVGRWPAEIGLSVDQFAALWRAADRLLEVGVEVPGGLAAAAGPRDWGICPRTGFDWGSGYAFDIDLFAGTDPRACWALHRLRHLQVLAIAGAAGHGRAEKAAREELLDWCAKNPPLRGLGWTAGIEVACRAASLLVIGKVAAEEWSAEDRQVLADALAAHRWMLQRYPSEYSSANNHAVAELGARVLLQDPVGGAFSRAFVAMVREDGSGEEEAPAYLAACVEWALLVRAAGQLEPEAEERLGAAGRFLGGLVDGLGRSPQIGDDDGDAALAGSRAGWFFDLAGLVASALDRPEHCPVAWMPGLRGALLGVGSCEGLRTVESGELGGGLARLVAGSAVAWVDRGRLGMAPMAAHGHADALSVWLHLGGRPVLVDSGTGTYLGDLDWRRWARSAGAHNGVVVGAADPVAQRGPFQWEPEPEGLWERTWFDAETGEAGGRWRGWGRVVHERRVRLTSLGLEIEDRLEGRGPVRIALPLHFSPELSLVPIEGGWEVHRDRHLLATAMVERPGLQTALITEGPAARVALEPGDPVAAPCLWAEGEVELPWRGLAVIQVGGGSAG